MPSHRRGPWTATEDSYLMDLVRLHGPHNWVRIAQILNTRTPKQCRERYHQNLKPSLNHDPISPEEGILIERLVHEMGKRWAEIARRLHGRSDNAVKNWWNGSQNRRKRLDKRRSLQMGAPAGSLSLRLPDEDHWTNRPSAYHPNNFAMRRQQPPPRQPPYRPPQSHYTYQPSPPTGMSSVGYPRLPPSPHTLQPIATHSHHYGGVNVPPLPSPVSSEKIESETTSSYGHSPDRPARSLDRSPALALAPIRTLVPPIQSTCERRPSADIAHSRLPPLHVPGELPTAPCSPTAKAGSYSAALPRYVPPPVTCSRPSSPNPQDRAVANQSSERSRRIMRLSSLVD